MDRAARRGMSQFAPVANLPTYWGLLERRLLGSYHLMIATEVIKDLHSWETFWSYPVMPMDIGANLFIIMDNGLIETGSPCDPQTLKEAADAVDASCIVLPDVLGSQKGTTKAASAAHPELSTLGYDLLGVIQGRNWDEIHFMCDLYTRMEVRYVSVPRVMVEFFGTRTKVIRRVQGLMPGVQIHLLGFSENLHDDMLAAVMPGVMGIDSAVPLWYPGILPTSTQ
jgi:hypothetical protein